jgi:hypothetical protein
MKTWKLLLAAIPLAILSLQSLKSQTAATPPANAESTSRRMFVDPSSTTVSLGKAKLTVSPLSLKEASYVGDYQLKVTPYFFKSQKGALTLVPTGDAVAQLSQGKAVEFTGKATNSTDGTMKVVKGKATPSAPDKGAVTFSITTENGEMIFNTTYHLAK